MKKFLTKILKRNDVPLYINIISFIPDWTQGKSISPYYFIEIRLAKNKKDLDTSKTRENINCFQLEALEKLRIKDLKLVVKKLFNIDEESKIKVNYCSSYCLITSWCPNKISQEDINDFVGFEETFQKNNPEVASTTRELFCFEARNFFQTHIYDICGEKENLSSKRERSPSSSEDTQL